MSFAARGKRRAAPLALAVGLGLAAAACGGRAGRGSVEESERAEAPAEEQAEAPAVEPIGQLQVKIYFPSATGEGLVAETRDVFDTTAPGDRARQILAALIEGPLSEEALPALPRETEVRQVYVLADGTAYVDFSPSLAAGSEGGSENEILAVYAVVDSLALNLPEMQRVGFLLGDVAGRAVWI